MNEVVNTLHHYGQDLSHNHHNALHSVIQTMADMAEGSAERRVYVSSLDPGMGKTTSLIVFLRQLMRSHIHQDVAVLVCLSRKAEIERIVEDAGLDEVDFAVLTRDEEVNALSSTPVGEARVLFTTQQMLLSRLRGGRFASGWGSQRVAVLAKTLLPEDLAPVLVLDASAE